MSKDITRPALAPALQSDLAAMNSGHLILAIKSPLRAAHARPLLTGYNLHRRGPKTTKPLLCPPKGAEPAYLSGSFSSVNFELRVISLNNTAAIIFIKYTLL
ncbi:hypothetical protein AVEN_203435-1 [Araneus ventricosus]|uniref:Uncharacterized protein n=1 Tax=Araneus ventricosus TaxID=182803 RepID=A0A4Y2BIQ3_ARAVE|nr:hypothetical protein AVEN_203435-1 [Araneus ventricosus]